MAIEIDLCSTNYGNCDDIAYSTRISILIGSGIYKYIPITKAREWIEQMGKKNVCT